MEDIGPTASIITLVILLIIVMVLYGFILSLQNTSKKKSIVAYLVWPMIVVVQWIGRLILGCFQNRDREFIQDVSEDEIISMIQEGHEQGVIQSSEAELITNIFEYTDKDAKDIMIWQKNIVSIDGGLPLKEVIFEQRYSRYPVYLDNLDHIVGILHIKDALKMQLAGEYLDTPVADIPNLLWKVEFIPETRNIDLLFKDMQSWKTQMVVVVDEYGQTSGLVAMEDILEEIVGNILDEYDEDNRHIEVKSDNEYILDGITPIEEIEDHLGITFPENEFDTINGYLIAQMEHLPEENEKFSYDLLGYCFQVLSVKNKMIERISVTKLIEEEEEERESEG